MAEFFKVDISCIDVYGACAGSTGGGMKVSRYIIYFKNIEKRIIYADSSAQRESNSM